MNMSTAGFLPLICSNGAVQMAALSHTHIAYLKVAISEEPDMMTAEKVDGYAGWGKYYAL